MHVGFSAFSPFVVALKNWLHATFPFLRPRPVDLAATRRLRFEALEGYLVALDDLLRHATHYTKHMFDLLVFSRRFFSPERRVSGP
jgi:hypothetical protein